MNMLMHTRQIAPEFWKGYWKHSIGFDRMVDTLMAVSYTHLTLPTNREV